MAFEAETAGGDKRSRGLGRVTLIAVELIVTAAALVVLFRGLDVPATARAFRHARYGFVALAGVFIVLDLQFRAVRWRLLLSPQQGLRHQNLFGATNVGYLVNDVLPFRAGEVARVFMIDELEKTGKVRSAASIAIERGIDLMAIIVLVVAMFPFVDEPAWTHGPAILIGIGVLAAFVLVIIVSHVNETNGAFWKGWLRRVPRIGGRLEDALNTLLMALHPLRRISLLAGVTSLTALVWASSTASYLMAMKAFHIDLGVSGAVIVMGSTTLGMIVPSSPGYVGVFHAIAVKTLMEVFGVPRESALTYAVAQHAVIYFVPATLGGMFLWSHQSTWRGVAASVGLRARRHDVSSGLPIEEQEAARGSSD